MTDKMREEFETWAVSEGMPITRGHYYDVYASAETRAAYLAWQAAKSVPVVERNQCDGCNRGLQVCDDGLHREPSGHPVMACTRNKYTHSITAAELERLRKCEALLKEAYGYTTAASDLLPERIKAAIAGEKK
mgnify:CR=1 FL=1